MRGQERGKKPVFVTSGVRKQCLPCLLIQFVTSKFEKPEFFLMSVEIVLLLSMT